ncbi:MAG: GNAT family N-acetyltransferase [Propionibacteriaceae bacterium]|jgi:RimJ/RimL family protein N-acetyltransferase|nr:GNAT family N-acetyltransferase [Propionibacteriaceae bacterium]
MTETHTDRLRLSPVDLDLAIMDDVYEFYLSPQAWSHLPQARPSDLESVRGYFSAHARSWMDHGLGWWVVRLRRELAGLAAETMVGVGGCAATRPQLPAWNLGYGLRPEVRGHGLATELALAGLTAAGRVDPTRPVTGRVLESNQASWRVMDKIGLTLVWQGDSPVQNGSTAGPPRRVYADRPLDQSLLDQLVALG